MSEDGPWRCNNDEILLRPDLLTISEDESVFSDDYYTDIAPSRTFLAHYTSISSLERIFQNREIKLNRIDKLNDLLEYKYLKPSMYGHESEFKNVFVGCFSYSEQESVPQWHMYTSSGSGVIIRFFLRRELGFEAQGLLDYRKAARLVYHDRVVEHTTDSKIRYEVLNCNSNAKQWWFRNRLGITLCVNITAVDILYSSHYMLVNPGYRINSEDQKPMMVKTNAGRIKDEGWGFEKETRVVCYVSSTRVADEVPFKLCEYILAPLNYRNIEKIQIVQSPWITEEGKEDISRICCKYLQGKKHFEVVDSYYLDALKPR